VQRLRGRRVRLIAAILAPILIGLFGAWLGLLVLGNESVDLGPFRVQVASQFARGETRIRLPPFGSLAAKTHDGPLRVTATLQSVDIQGLTDRLQHGSVQDLVDEVEEKALHDVVPYAWRLIGASAVGALVVSLLAFRLRWKPVALAVATALAVTGGTETAAWATFQPSALLTPTFAGTLSFAPKLIGPAQSVIGRIDDFRSELGRIVDGAVRVYTSIQSLPPVGEDQIRVLHVSDVHLSPLGMAFAQRVASAFDVDFVIDTGDITSFGTPAEDTILSAIPDFRRPYVFVRGNHDSMSLQEDMARLPNALVLDGSTRTLRGLTIYGLGDPVFTPNKQAALDDAGIATAVTASGAIVASDVSRLSRPPDIVAVHDDRMALAVAGRVPLVISGHFHQASARVIDGTLFLRVGSTGGAGANVFTESGGVPLSAEILYFSREAQPALVAYDLIEQSPESGSLTVTRHLIERDFGTLVPSPPPSPSPSPSTSGTPSTSPTPS
jgi:predicted MPP superfamily phosphohydrolase